MRTPSISFGIAVPQTYGRDDVDLPRLKACLHQAEAWGFDSLWVHDDTLTASGTLEPLSTLAFAAAHTSDIRLGVAVLIAPTRSSVHLAKECATVDQLSHGRLIVGLGGGRPTPNDAAFEASGHARGTRVEETVEVMRRLWRGGPQDYKGIALDLDQAEMTPTPRQLAPPIWIGGSSAPALRRAARLGDGFVAGGASTTKEFAQQVALVRNELDRQGRDRERFTLAKRMYVAYSSDVDRDSKRLTESLTWYYGDADLAERIGVIGDAEHCAAAVQAVVDAGATTVILNPLFDELIALEALSQEVIPRLKGISRRSP